MAWTSWAFDFEPDGVTPQEVTEDQFRHTLAAASQSGVGGEDHLAVSALADSSAVSLAPGYGSVAGYSCYGDTDTQVTAPANEASTARLYWVVLRLDRSARQITPAVVEGSASSSPQLPALSRDPDTVFEEPLASFRRAGSGGGITDLVDYRAVINPQGSRAVSSGARPPYPADGERIYETDTGREMYYHSGTWQVSADPSYPTPWVDMVLGANMSHPGHGYPPAWRWDAPGLVRLRGRVCRTNGNPIGHLSYVARLPEALRPTVDVGFAVPSQRGNEGTMTRIEISNSEADHGRIFVWLPAATSYDPNWISFDGVTYTL